MIWYSEPVSAFIYFTIIRKFICFIRMDPHGKMTHTNKSISSLKGCESVIDLISDIFEPHSSPGVLLKVW
jgi:hypothetical protein